MSSPPLFAPSVFRQAGGGEGPGPRTWRGPDGKAGVGQPPLLLPPLLWLVLSPARSVVPTNAQYSYNTFLSSPLTAEKTPTIVLSSLPPSVIR